MENSAKKEGERERGGKMYYRNEWNGVRLRGELGTMEGRFKIQNFD